MAEEEESETPNLDEMRRQIAEHDAAASEEAALAEQQRLAPYHELVESNELETVRNKLSELRQVYIGEDEDRFRKLDAAYLALKRI